MVKHGHGAHGPHEHACGDHSARPFVLSLALNVAFVVVEAVAGVGAHSLSLVADAAHNFGDALGLALAGAAAVLAGRPPSTRRTYGMRRATILAALANATVLLFAAAGVTWEAVSRLRTPAPVQGGVVVVVAALGIAVNGGSALLFLRRRRSDVNVRAAFLHLVADASVSAAVLAGGILTSATGAVWIDPVVSLLVSAAILVSTWSVLGESLNLALDAVPVGIDPDEVRAHLAAIDGVLDVHDLHIWAMSTTETALTAHLTMRTGSCHPALLRNVGRELDQRFKIHHATLQVEPPDAPGECAQAGAHAL
jgi:cobalt-zinc-cadmium efflux system protein